MKRTLLISFLVLALFRQAAAQERPDPLKQADQLYERYEYFKSLSIYLQLARKTSDLHIVERIADCYRNMNHYPEAEEWYARLVTERGAGMISHYHYAEMLLRNKKFDQARTQYKLYFSKVADPALMALKIAGCDSAALWTRQSSGYLISNEEKLNGPFAEWGLVEYGTEQRIFTSDRNTRIKDNRTGNGWFKLYVAGAEDAVQEELTLSSDWNSLKNNYHFGPVAFYKDTAYVTVTTDIKPGRIKTERTGRQRLYTRRLQLVMAVRKGEGWVITEGFKYNDISSYSTGHAALSSDGQWLYFTSDRPGGIGKTDIWFCKKQSDGTWTMPVNCGASINTSEEEAFPQISGSGILYYSSKGFPGMGGYDVFSARGTGTNWAKPLNLRYPVNSTSDDFYLVTRDGSAGYFSSNREGGKGSDDIYSFKYLQPQVPLSKDTLKTGQTFVLQNIYYDLDKFSIRPDAAIELDKLALILMQQPKLKIELSSHTDSRAADDYNMVLSQRRADAAVAYLIVKGIAAERLTARGYGETRLLNKCGNDVSCSEQDHQLNRRTEIKVLP